MSPFIYYRAKYFHSPIAFSTPFRIGVHFGEDESTNGAATANVIEDANAPGGIMGKLIFHFNTMKTIIFIICSWDLDKS